MNKKTIIPTRSWTSQASPSSPSGFYDVSFLRPFSSKRLFRRRAPARLFATGGGEVFLTAQRERHRVIVK